MYSPLRIASLAIVVFLIAALPVSGQRSDPFNPYNPPGSSAGGQLYGAGAVVHVIVLNEKHKHLDQQAVVRLIGKTEKSTYYGTTTDHSEVDIVGIELVGTYDVEVSSFGYSTAHQPLMVGSVIGTFQVNITLQPDPAAVNLNAALGSQLPAKVRKQTQRGVTYLKSGDLKHAEKELEGAERQEPSSPEIAFLLGYLQLQRKEDASAQTYLEKAATLDPKNVQALTMLGKLHIAHKEYAIARTSLEQAVAADPDFWNAHYLLANDCLWLKDYAPSRDHAQLAIDKGKGAASEAYLVLGQAEANLGHFKEAIAALYSYLQHNPSSPALAQVQKYLGDLERHAEEVKAGKAVPTSTFAVTSVIQVEDNIDDLRLAAKGWAPPGVDDVKPQVAADVVCPTTGVLDLSGKRVKELVDNVAKFAAVEEVLHENVDESGHPVSHETRSFDYSVEIAESHGALGVDEYRIAHGDLSDFPDQIASRGFPALAMVFHPSMRDNFQMTCEGLGQWKNQATWLVYFRQRDDRPNKMHDYQVGTQTYAADLKGRAWISADDFQIVHMESELVAPIRKIHLLTEHQAVDYGPVLFAAKKEQLWLPKSADLYVDFQRHRFHRRHSYDRFLLFAVDSSSKDKVPVAPPVDKPAAPGEKGPQQ